MATKIENERLAVLETQMTTVVADVGEIKSDVKSLIADRYARHGLWAGIKTAAPWIAIMISLIAVAVRG